MANYTDPKVKFGVVHGTPSQLTAEKIEEGKLYFLSGEANGTVKQGIYGIDPLTSDSVNGVFNVAMFGTGALVDANGPGLMSTEDFNKLSEFGAASTYLTKADASTTYLKITDYKQVSKDASGWVPKADASAGTIDSQTNDWVLAYDGSKVDWFKLPANAFKDTTYTGSAPISVNNSTNVISHETSGVTAGRYGDTSSARTLEFGGKFKVVDISVNTYGHITKASTYELTLPAKPSTAGTADEAKKTTGTLTIKGNGTTVETFNGSEASEINIKSSNTQLLTVTGASDGSITITPVTAVVSTDSTALATGAQIASYISTQLGSLTGALVYKGTVSASTGLPSNASTGWVYVASAAFTYNDGTTNWSVESGDMFIYNGSKWNVVNGENQVSNKNATLKVGGEETVATIDGTDIKITLPAKGESYYTHPTSTSGTTTVSSSDGGDFSFSTTNNTIKVLTGATRDASGHIGKVIYKDLYLPDTAYSDTIYTHPISISGTTLSDSSLKSTTATSINYDGTFTVATGVYRDASGHINKVETETFKLPSAPEIYVHPKPESGTIEAPSNTSTATTFITRVKIDASGHVVDTSAFNGTVGGTTTPVYFKAGVPTKLSYTISKSVPASAVFTDNNVKTSASTSKLFLVGKTDASKDASSEANYNANVYIDSSCLYSNGIKVATVNDIESTTIYWETL